MKRTSFLVPGIVGVVLAWHGLWWGLGITVVCVALAARRDSATINSPEAVAHRVAWHHAAKHWWTAPESGTYRFDSYQGMVEMKLRSGQQIRVLDDGPEPVRVA